MSSSSTPRRRTKTKIFNDPPVLLLLQNTFVDRQRRPGSSFLLSAPRFIDRIHGHIELHPLCCAVIDTPQYQRLRDLLQLGGCYHVFPGASHHRFEHCIGTSYLAHKLVAHLRAVQPELKITDEEVLCVTLAGLCHDLGHGIYSHLFDLKFIRRANPAAHASGWEHEHASVAMLRYLIEDNDLRGEFAHYGLHDEHIQFIQELILGSADEAPRAWRWQGWPPAGTDDVRDRGFLFEIVSNKRNGIDVDKFDYFARDCHHLGIPVSFDSSRLMRFARVMTAADAPVSPAPLQICFHEKEAWNIYELFHTRYTLHKRAYQHRVSRVYEAMLTEVLVLADPHLRVHRLPGPRALEAVGNGTDGSGNGDGGANGAGAGAGAGGGGGGGKDWCRMSEAIFDMRAYATVSDALLRRIEFSTHVPALAPARALLRRLHRRQFWKFVGETLLPKGKRLSTHSPIAHAAAAGGGGAQGASSADPKDEALALVRRALCSAAPGAGAAGGVALHEDDFYLETVNINYGKKAANPVDACRFYSRTTGDSAYETKAHAISAASVSCLAPTVFQEQYLRVYCKSFDPAVRKEARRRFEQWCVNKAQLPPPTPQKAPAAAPSAGTVGAGRGGGEPSHKRLKLSK